MKNMAIPSKEKLENLYIIQKLPIHKISNILNMSVGKVYNLIKKYEITTRNQRETFTFKGHTLNEEQRNRISKLHKNKVIPLVTREKISKAKQGKYRIKTEFGGHRTKRKDGYIAIYTPTHPNANKSGYVMEHVLIMEKHINRYLKDDEVAHHKNKIRDDNRIENLQLMTFREHAGFHLKERQKLKKKG